GLLKTIRISKHLTNMNGDPLSNITINVIPKEQDTWHLRIEVKDVAKHVGGCTLFGKGLGNYDQDFKLKVYYSRYFSIL
ncbi:transcriptional regulator, partial [Enterococcus faecium]